MDYDRIEEYRNEDGDIFKTVVTERGTRYSNLDCQNRTKAATHGVSRWFSRAVKTRTAWTDPDMRKDEIERLRWLLDDMASYVAAASKHLDTLEDSDRLGERIAALERIAGREPAEAAAYLAKATELRARP